LDAGIVRPPPAGPFTHSADEAQAPGHPWQNAGMPVKPIPEGFHTVTPYLAVADPAKLLDFVQRALGATVKEVMRSPDGQVVHADVVIGDSHVMMGIAHGEWKPTTTTLYLYVSDCDAMFRRAVDAGGKPVREPRTEFYGDRSGGVADAFGNQWWFATHVEDVSPEEMERRVKEQRPQQVSA
jgi:PhnB protein